MHPIFFTEIKLANLKSLLFIWFKALRRGKKVCKKYNKISVTECVKEVNIWRRLAPNSLQVAFKNNHGAVRRLKWLVQGNIVQYKDENQLLSKWCLFQKLRFVFTVYLFGQCYAPGSFVIRIYLEKVIFT